MEDNWEQSLRSKSRISDSSHLTATSADSGYVSGFRDGGTLKSIIGKGMSIGSIFRRSGDKSEMPRHGARSTTLKLVQLRFLVQFANHSRECVSCMDDFESKELVPLNCHSYCKTCFQNLIG
jgi:hypothetical protein